ncbi:MAG TPA: DUF2752 domain-containing protein [Edaphobacter sp.]|jgi:hypothetical protein|nr:DUF2752 domain-containing protein [Edaphobacter sp.]
MIPARRSRTADTLRAAMPPAIIALAAILLLRFPPAQYSFYPRCPIHELFHLQCPGCGATRAVAALLHGHFIEAMSLNALITLLLPCAAAYGLLCYCRLLQCKPLRWPQPPPAVLYALFSVTAIFTIIRNLPLH